jgi:hypothetical protein
MKIEASAVDEWLDAGFMCLKSIGFCYIGCQFSHPKSALIACVLTLRTVIVLMSVRMSGLPLISYRAAESLSVLPAVYCA